MAKMLRNTFMDPPLNGSMQYAGLCLYNLKDSKECVSKMALQGITETKLIPHRKRSMRGGGDVSREK
jgi:hypothetical protein